MEAKVSLSFRAVAALKNVFTQPGPKAADQMLSIIDCAMLE